MFEIKESRIKASSASDLKITSPEVIKTLPWQSNYAADWALFRLVDQYINQEPDHEQAYKAEVLVNLHGMGEVLPDQMPADYPEYHNEKRELDEDGNIR